MTTITRTIFPGAVEDLEQLQHELSEAGIGTYCEGVSLDVDGVTLSMTFISTPDDEAVDDVITAHPSYTPGLAASKSLAADTWTTIWTRPLAATGRYLEVDAEIALRIGDPETMQVCMIHIDGLGVRQRGAATCSVGMDGGTPYGDDFGASARFVSDGSRMLLQIKTADASDVVISGQVLEPTGQVFID